jgi:hypothetical protein
MGGKNNWGLVIAGLTALATLGAWLFPGGIRSLSPAPEKATLREPIGAQRIALAEPEAKHQAQSPEINAQDGKSLKPSPPAPLADGEAERTAHYWKPRNFTLLDQEQRAIVAGCASLAVEFQEVAGVDFVTVRINTGDESSSHAVSQAGEQFRFTCDDDNYRASILLVDRAAGIVRVGVEKITS